MSSSTKNDGGGGEVKKFLFDTNNFDKAKVAEVDLPAYTEAQIGVARDQSRAQGRDEGLAEARTRQEEHIAATVDKILVHINVLAQQEEERDVQRMIDATRLTMTITHKLLPQLAQKFSLPEIERVILQSIEARKDEARIAVIVSPVHLEDLKTRIDALAHEKGFAGKMIIVADDHLAPTDCRVEWADGGTERLYERLFAQVETEFAKAIAGMQNTIEDIKDNNG